MAAPTVAQPPKDFYVYLHRRATTGEVFYVGKGRGKRAKVSTKRSKHWHAIVAKHGLIIEFVAVGLREWYALELETELISYYGRLDLGEGPLINLCDGGEGLSGHKPSLETRAKRSLAVKGFTHSLATRARLSSLKKGRRLPHLDRSGCTLTEEHKLKIKKAMVYRQVPLICGNGTVFDSFAEAIIWLKEQGFLKAAYSALRMCCKGKIKQAYGYTWRYA